VWDFDPNRGKLGELRSLSLLVRRGPSQFPPS
jgi:hypothetical protein